MKNILKNIFVLVLSLGLATYTIAQNDFTLYQMRALPQVVTVNPSVMPLSKVNIGLPGISANYFNIGNNGFTYSDAVELGDNGSLNLNLDNAINQMNSTNRISTYYRTDLLSFGFKAGNNYFSFSVTEKFDFNFYYPKGLIDFAWQGNGGDYLGQRISFDNIGVDAIHYRQYGVGWARRLTPNLQIGGRFNYLYGQEAVYTRNSQFGIFTDPIDYSWEIDAAMELNTSGVTNVQKTIDGISSGDLTKIQDYLLNGKNTGYSFDIGANYTLFDLINISASAIDIGSLTWRDNIENYNLKNDTFNFEGVDIFELFDPQSSSTSTGGIENLADSIVGFFNNIDTNTSTFKTPLNTQFYLGATYNLTNRVKLGILTRNQFIRGDLTTSLSASVSTTLGNFFSTSINYSLYGRSLGNLGVGISANFAPLQIYIITDNAFAGLSPQNVKNVHLRFGINLTFGRDYEL